MLGCGGGQRDARRGDASDNGPRLPARYGQNDQEIALTRKNALFAGSDGGAAHWAVIASLIETCKLIGVEPRAYLADVISRIVNGHPQSRLDELLPWAYPTHPPSRRPLKKQNTAYEWARHIADDPNATPQAKRVAAHILAQPPKTVQFTINANNPIVRKLSDLEFND